ncbi:MAG TPA: hypothetical protein VN851_24770 [Thermoanaerobaculia bacterium]|nr:hypothetical protein [Thermoanaerobaculia bacterium]
MDLRKQSPRNSTWLVALAASLLLNGGSARADQSQVMDPTLPSGTIVGLDPGYPELTGVSTRIEGETLVVEATFAAPVGAFEPGTPDYQLCQKPGARCAEFEVHLPTGHVVGGRFEFSVRAADSAVWTALKTRRETMVLRPDHTFADTGAYQHEYEEFQGFSLALLSASSNCAVKGREETAWEVRLWKPQSIVFRISIPLARCPDLKTSEDTAD